MRRLCKRCGERPAKYRYKDRVKSRADHDLCFECFRSVSDSQRQVAPRAVQGLPSTRFIRKA